MGRVTQQRQTIRQNPTDHLHNEYQTRQQDGESKFALKVLLMARVMSIFFPNTMVMRVAHACSLAIILGWFTIRQHALTNQSFRVAYFVLRIPNHHQR
jgi:hypothetical protein